MMSVVCLSPLGIGVQVAELLKLNHNQSKKTKNNPGGVSKI